MELRVVRLYLHATVVLSYYLRMDTVLNSML